MLVLLKETNSQKGKMMATFYQHDDEVIEAARILKRALLEDSPFGNEDQAQKWLKETYPQVVSLAAQTTYDEERRKFFQNH